MFIYDKIIVGDRMKRVVPVKNYIILIIVVIASILLTFFLTNVYKDRLNDNISRTVMYDFLSQVNNDELENYLLENPNTIIYYASSSDVSLNEFEEKFKELIIKYDLINSIVQFDIQNEKNRYTNITIYSEGVEKDTLYSEKTEINILDVENFLKDKSIIND